MICVINILLVIILKHSLNFDKSDSNYILLKEIFKIIDLRKSEQIIASQGIKNIKKFTDALKYYLSLYFSVMIFLLSLMK